MNRRLTLAAAGVTLLLTYDLAGAAAATVALPVARPGWAQHQTVVACRPKSGGRPLLRATIWWRTQGARLVVDQVTPWPGVADTYTPYVTRPGSRVHRDVPVTSTGRVTVHTRLSTRRMFFAPYCDITKSLP